MNEVMEKTMQTPIEIALGIDENGMTTARSLYDFLDLGKGQFSRWAKTNIENNEYYQEGHDWWGFDIVSSGNKCKDYRLTTDFAKHLSMESHSEKGKIARQYFVNIEDKAKQFVIDRKSLSPQMQMFYALADSQAKVELEQKRQAEKLDKLEANQNRLEQKQNAIAETFSAPSDIENFQAWAKKCITKIAESPMFDKGQGRNYNHQCAWGESYARLKKKWNCNLDDRVARAKGRAMQQNPGITKAQLNSINKLTIISSDKSLRPVYETVIKEMMIQYCVECDK